MKNIFKIVAVVLGLSMMVSCNDLLDINTDPDEASQGNPPQVLTSAEGFMTWVIGERFPQRSNLWAQYWTWGPGVQLGNAERFIMEPDDNNNVWFRSYVNALPDLDYLNQQGEPVYGGIAKTLEAYLYSTLVDYFGDIPFSEAVQGADENNPILSPKFDDDQAVYAGCLEKLDAALADFAAVSTASANPGDADFFFGGDVDQWVKFTNSLKLKLLMRQTNVDGVNVSTQVQDLVAGGNFIESAGDIAKVDFIGTSGDQNPQYASFESGVGQFYIASNTTLRVLETTSDPRIDAFYEVSVNNGIHIGIDQGTIEDEPFGNPQAEYSTPAGTNDPAMIYGEDLPVIFMSPWEVWFLRAEAAARFGTADDEAASFENAIEANFDYLGVVGGGAFATGLGYDAGGDIKARIKAIATQKWVSMNGLQATESWTETRRLDTPGNPIFTGTDEGLFDYPVESTLPAGVYPTIYLIPEAERSFNPNAPAQQVITDKVFWDN